MRKFVDAPVSKRRSDRVFLRAPVFIIGIDLNGRDFFEHAATESLSRYGASIITKLALSPDQEITLSRPDGTEIEAQVIGQLGTRPDGNLYGIRFTNTALNFWKIDFPPLGEDSFAKTLLECRVCRAREIVSLDGTELDVFQANRFLRRPCKQCRNVTIWGFAESEPAPDRVHQQQDAEPAKGKTPPAAEQSAEATPAATTSPPRQERRKHPRVRLKLKACIKEHMLEDDIVEVINMSRGGILVSSKRVYRVGSWIQIAVPYTPAAANIFVSARIVRRAEVGENHQYGIKYVSG